MDRLWICTIWLTAFVSTAVVERPKRGVQGGAFSYSHVIHDHGPYHAPNHGPPPVSYFTPDKSYPVDIAPANPVPYESAEPIPYRLKNAVKVPRPHPVTEFKSVPNHDEDPGEDQKDESYHIGGSYHSEYSIGDGDDGGDRHY